MKPLNWMVAPRHVETPPYGYRVATWVFANRKERLEIVLYDVLSDTEHELERSDPGLQKRGTEKELQTWLARHPDVFGVGWVFLAREHPTGAGPVDLLMLDAEGVRVAVEVKRTASIGGVDQVSRYVEALLADTDTTPVRGLLIAFDVRPKARQLAESRGFTWLEVSKERFLRDE